jgi:hypothetical protein
MDFIQFLFSEHLAFWFGFFLPSNDPTAYICLQSYEQLGIIYEQFFQCVALTWNFNRK